MFEFFLLTVFLVIVELSYFRIAELFNIVDKPNDRSSHIFVTIRGGGIIFPISWLIYSILHGFVFPWVSVGLLAIAIVSFADDRVALSSRLRFLIHLIAFTLCFYQLDLFNILPIWMIPIVYIVGIGCVNAVNFMDGINGMTGLYSLAVLIPIQWFMYHQLWNGSLFNYLILSIVVFGYFNFRKKARCFAGDVGSVSIGYILVFILLGFIFHRFEFLTTRPWLTISAHQDFLVDVQYILLLTLYGLDSIGTLTHRLILKENIFEAHRRHLYQLLCNEYKFSHVSIASIYALIQVFICIYVLTQQVANLEIIFFLLILSILYGLFKYWLILKK